MGRQDDNEVEDTLSDEVVTFTNQTIIVSPFSSQGLVGSDTFDRVLILFPVPIDARISYNLMADKTTLVLSYPWPSTYTPQGMKGLAKNKLIRNLNQSALEFALLSALHANQRDNGLNTEILVKLPFEVARESVQIIGHNKTDVLMIFNRVEVDEEGHFSFEESNSSTK